MEYKKRFDEWNKEKKSIDGGDGRKFFIKPREIWFTKMGENIGFEENGKKEFTRPVLVIKKVGNLFFTVALTTKGKDNKFYHLFREAAFASEQLENEKKSSAILSQVRVMDKKRFEEKIGTLSEDEFETIKQKLTAMLL